MINKCIDEIEIDRFAISSNLIKDGQMVLGMSSFPEWDKLKAPKKLSTVSDPILREQEIKDICKILEIVSKQYLARVRNWLASMFPTEDLDCLFISGGASKFLQAEIEKHCNSYHRVKLEVSKDALKHQYYQGLLSGEYISLGEYDERIELINDRLLARKVGAEYKIAPDEIEKMALDSRLVDNYGSLKRLLDFEKKYQAKQRSARATKAAKASKEARENKAALLETVDSLNGSVAVESGSQIANTSNGSTKVDSRDSTLVSQEVRPNEEENEPTAN